MHRLSHLLHAVSRHVPRALSLALLMVLPFGYYPDYPDSSQFEIGIGGGYGQIASVVRSCDGGMIQKEENQFTDLSVTGFGRYRISDRTEFIYGAQLGYFRATARLADLPLDYPDSHLERWYFGPRIAMETKYFGAGLGFVANRVPYTFEHESDWEKNEFGPSFHLRLGSLRGFYFLGSFAENSPLIAGGGYFNAGFGYPLGRRIRMYSALSAGPYDHVGYLQQVDLGLSKTMALNLAIRAGESEQIFEGAASATLVFRFGQVKTNSVEKVKEY